MSAGRGEARCERQRASSNRFTAFRLIPYSFGADIVSDPQGNTRPVQLIRQSLQNLFGGWTRSRDTVGEVQNGAQTTPVVGAEQSEVMPLVNYRGSEEAVLHEIHEVAGRRQSAKQVLRSQQPVVPVCLRCLRTLGPTY